MGRDCRGSEYHDECWLGYHLDRIEQRNVLPAEEPTMRDERQRTWAPVLFD